MKIAKFALIIVSIFYPFTIVFVLEYSHIIVATLCILWGVRYFFERQRFAIFVAIFFIFTFFVSSLKFAYPVLINLGLFFTFLISLKSTPIITRIALLKEPNLDENGINYTRKLTKIWIYFFVFNAALSLIFALLKDKSIWAFYCGVISYALIAILFFGEILYRRYVLKV